MALTDAETRKSELSMMSTGATTSQLNTTEIISEKDSLAKSSRQNNVRTYNLYSGIKDFAFYMPEGWNDLEIGIFIELCHENIDQLKKVIKDENSKWKEIVDAGAKRSLNPTLFTINSCMEVAQCIRQYVKRNKDKKKNKAFQKFCGDVKSLLKYFPPSPDEIRAMKKGKRGKGKILDIEECENVFSYDSDEEQHLSDSIYRNLPAIQSGNQGVWDDISAEVDRKTNYNIDVKEYLELLKYNIISEIYEKTNEEEKKSIVSKIRPYLLEVFDFVPPEYVSKRDLMNMVYTSGKTVESKVPKNRQGSSVSKKEQPSCQKGVKESVGVSDGNLWPVKKKRGRPRKKADSFSGQSSHDPSSIAILHEENHNDSSLSQCQIVIEGKTYQIKVPDFVQLGGNLNPVVKLRIMTESELQEALAMKAMSNGNVSNTVENESSFSVPSAEIPAESAFVGTDVITTDVIYNPNTDTAKTHAGPITPTINRRPGKRKRKSSSHVPPKIKKRITNKNNYSDSGIPKKTLDSGKHLKSISNVARESLSNEQPCCSHERHSESSLSTDMVTEDNRSVSQNAGTSRTEEPSTSNISRNLAKMASLMMNVHERNREERMELQFNKPDWLDEFMESYKNHRTWNLQKITQMHQEIMDAEIQKINLAKELLTFVKNQLNE